MSNPELRDAYFGELLRVAELAEKGEEEGLAGLEAAATNALQALRELGPSGEGLRFLEELEGALAKMLTPAARENPGERAAIRRRVLSSVIFANVCFAEINPEEITTEEMEAEKLRHAALGFGTGHGTGLKHPPAPTPVR